jgi:hypothetical protein
MEYKPYTLEWSRKRYLNEAIQKYIECDVDTKIIIDDIVDCLSESISFHKDRAEKMQVIVNVISGIHDKQL